MSRASHVMSDRELRQVAQAAIDRGWVIERTPKHVRLTHPSGVHVFTSGTRGSKGRGVKNFQAAIARVERAAVA